MTVSHNQTNYRIRFFYRCKDDVAGKALENVRDKKIVTEATISKEIEGNWVDIASGRA